MTSKRTKLLLSPLRWQCTIFQVSEVSLVKYIKLFQCCSLSPLLNGCIHCYSCRTKTCTKMGKNDYFVSRSMDRKGCPGPLLQPPSPPCVAGTISYSPFHKKWWKSLWIFHLSKIIKRNIPGKENEMISEPPKGLNKKLTFNLTSAVSFQNYLLPNHDNNMQGELPYAY